MNLNDMTFGTDSAQVEQYIEDLKTNLIDECVNSMRESHANLKANISTYWSGVSAQRFLNSYEQTINSAADMLETLKTALNKYMLQVKNNVIDTEAALWDETENPFSGNSDPSSHKWSE